MKKIFFFALASLALASCSQDEEFVAEKSTNGSDRANGALTFSTYTAGATRAVDVTAADIKAAKDANGGFKIAAWYDGALYFNAGEAAYVTANKDIQNDEIFETDIDTYYWPSFSAGDIGFRGFNIGSGAAWTTGKEYFSIDFTPADDASAQKDLVIAYDTADAKPTAHGNGVQPLNFTHALSKVNFSFKGTTAANKYTINKIEVIAAGEKSTGNTAPIASFVKGELTTAAGISAGKQADKVSWDFTEIDGTAALVAKTATDGLTKQAQGTLYQYDKQKAADTKADVVVDGTDATDLNYNLMLLPQSGKIAVRVYYKVEDATKLIGNCGYYLTDSKGRHNDGATNSKYDNTDGLAIYGCKTVIIDLTADAVKWEAGKSYRFTLTLPDDNFIGDKSGDGVADMKDPDNGEDLDGDNDDTEADPSEFDQLTPIKFCCTVSAWEAEGTASAITIK